MRKLLIVVFATCLSAAAQTAPAKSAPAAAPDKPLQALPYSPSLDLNDMDKSVDPCVDFYHLFLWWLAEEESDSRRTSRRGASTASCTTTISSSCGAFSTISRSRPPGARPTQQKIGDYFAACMDEAAVEKLGAAPLKPQLDAIAAHEVEEGPGAAARQAAA